MKMSRNFPLNGLRVFEAAARHLSFTKAGEELGLTQTAVSYQIKLLEETLGQSLFLRRPRQVTLTDAGRKLAPKVTEGFGTLTEAVGSLRQDANDTLTINAPMTITSQWLARRIGTFQMQHANLAVRLDTTQSIIDFSRVEADVAIRIGKGEWPGLTSHLLLRGAFTPMLSPKLAETIGGIEHPSDLLKLRIIDPGDPWWRIWFDAAGVPDADLKKHPRSQLGVQSYEANAAMAGQGVAILTPAYYAEEVAAGRLVQPFDLSCNDGNDCWVVYPEHRGRTPKIKAFLDWIMATASVDWPIPTP